MTANFFLIFFLFVLLGLVDDLPLSDLGIVIRSGSARYCAPIVDIYEVEC